MLTDEDLLFMKQTRNELTKNRKRPITVRYMDGEPDPWTGEIEDEITDDRELMAVVTEISSPTSAGAERYIVLGIKYEKGDIWLSISIEDVEDVADKIERIIYEGKEYMILAMDKKGIGIRNRFEVLARVTS